MNILLMGCSWAVPNYYGKPGDPADTHTEFLLKALGHTVHNCGLNAGSNLMSLDRAKQYLNGIEINHPAIIGTVKKTNLETIDLVIWFHTEPGRDHNLITQDISINQQLDEICNVTYKEYAKFFKDLGCKIAVIGGCSDVHPALYNYIQPDFCLPSWQKTLIGVSSMGFKTNPVSKPSVEDIKFLDNAKFVLSAMEQSRLFPDNGHPGAIAHKELTKVLSKIFNLGV